MLLKRDSLRPIWLYCSIEGLLRRHGILLHVCAVDDVTHVYDDVTHVYDDVRHVYDDVTHVYAAPLWSSATCMCVCVHAYVSVRAGGCPCVFVCVCVDLRAEVHV